MALQKHTYVSIILFAWLIVFLIITTGCTKITASGVGIKPTGIQQEILPPTINSPTPTIAKTSPIPEEKNTRTQVITYTIQTGDTIFGIAEKFNLKPDTILWGNPDIFEDLQNITIMPGIVLNILPVDGAYHRWKAGEDLNEVAKTYGVSTQAIVNWPGNNLDPQTLGDYSNPNIEPGTLLVITGGNLPFTSWSEP
jgi:LysM repeat protein